eukprot:4652344-Lingulodinium_polyedra.AAC.1
MVNRPDQNANLGPTYDLRALQIPRTHGDRGSPSESQRNQTTPPRRPNPLNGWAAPDLHCRTLEHRPNRQIERMVRNGNGLSGAPKQTHGVNGPNVRKIGRLEINALGGDPRP